MVDHVLVPACALVDVTPGAVSKHLSTVVLILNVVDVVRTCDDTIIGIRRMSWCID